LYNLLVVDDLKKVVHGLVYDIPWSKIDIHEIHKAYSAREALEVMHKNRIDIVITDIRMPGMNGMELIQKIKETWKYCKVLILSGYDEFEYAKTAIELGVFRYLTKPYPYEELLEEVRLAIIDIEQQLEQKKALELAHAYIRDSIPLLKEHLLGQIVQGHTEILNQTKIWEKYPFRVQAMHPTLLVMIKVDQWKKKPDVNEIKVNETAIRYFAKDILFSDKEAIESFVDLYGDLFIIVQSVSEDQIFDVLRTVKGNAVLLQQTVYRTLGATISIYYSAPFDALYRLPTVYMKVKQVAQRALSLPLGMIKGTDDFTVRGAKHQLELAAHLQAFIHQSLLYSESPDTVMKQMAGWFDRIKSEAEHSYESLISVYHLIILWILQDSMKRGFRLDDWLGEDRTFFQGIDQFKTLHQMQDQTQHMLATYEHFIASQEFKQSNHVIEKAIEFIKQNFTRDITVHDIAEEVYLHPNYLSRLFKKVTGQSISDFMIKLRIEKAKYLLKQDASTKVYEVAHQIGYESVPHFQTIFKKMVGTSPREYQLSRSSE
jgi:two-component system response regulator YesN